MVEPLYYGHHWDPSNCPGVLNSGVVLYRITTIGTKASVLISEVSTARGSTVHVQMYVHVHVYIASYTVTCTMIQ